MYRIPFGFAAIKCTGVGFINVILESSRYYSVRDHGSREYQFQSYGGDVRIIPNHIASMLIDQYPDRFRWANNDEVMGLT
jgi:hypothetical protein